jgi:hypothetical protein
LFSFRISFRIGFLIDKIDRQFTFKFPSSETRGRPRGVRQVEQGAAIFSIERRGGDSRVSSNASE